MAKTYPQALLADLDRVGCQVDDIWDLVNSKVQYPKAVPVLLEWLENVRTWVLPEKEKQYRVHEALVRALTIPAARPVAAPVMIDQFRTVDDSSGLGLRWAVGNALSVVADESVFDDLASIVKERRYGKARQMPVLGLSRIRDPRVVPLLTDLLEDDDVAAHAVMALGKIRAPGVRSAVEVLLEHPQPLVRREARKALKVLP
jgi:HEAT repeat protein